MLCLPELGEISYMHTGNGLKRAAGMRRKSVLSVGLTCLLVACGGGRDAGPSDVAMRWDHRPEATEWTKASLDAIEDNGSVLTDLVPRDIKDWCPKYAKNSDEERALFWVGLASTLAKHESTWNPEAVGGGGQWFGLVQISPQTARGYGCEATTPYALKDGAANLQCAMKIWSSTVIRDQVVAEDWRGVAADWGPFHTKEKREDMRDWTRAQSYCN
jgi:hypothetical protein